ncbi:tRNA (N6-isopentenyl adenosine(37)-C2)-methylthiotransferase MiaB [Eubacteriales bacterium OttesenSCG-928-N14]|nr:tRNA (N6-isopentenyl adenosine(37)-C2)-methylthiotransferase MiaB [Eubacteriales bacterium OttesenSCG-928-N14]
MDKNVNIYLEEAMQANAVQFDAIQYHKTDNPTYYIHTFGCQMNVRDSQSAAGILQSMGYTPAENMETADIILFNTCCIRDLAEQKAVGAIGATRKLKEQKPAMIIGAFGCMMEQEGMIANIHRRFPYLQLLFGTNRLHLLPDMLIDLQLHHKTHAGPEDTNKQFDLITAHNAPPLAYINIMQGCNNYCSYCIVPYVRGRETSRPMQQILAEAEQLLQTGYQEIMLLGQNVNSYRDGAHDFATLLKNVNALGVPRIRFMTSHPKDLSPDVIAAMSDCDGVCKQLHLPVQSGSNAVLERMNRKCTREHYLKLISRLRAAMPDIGLSTDIIVGFPGETEADFADTLSLMEQVRFDSAFTFKFSPRRGTPAADMVDALSKEIKETRLAQLNALQRQITKEVFAALVGQTMPVLIEGKSKRNQAHVSGKCERGIGVTLQGSQADIGKIIDVTITKANVNTLFGVKA